MDIINVYETLKSLEVKTTQLPTFNQGYAFYLERRAMGWIPIEVPCRLVYRYRDTVSMIIMPFLIPKYAEKIWGFEIFGVLYGLNYEKVQAFTNKDVECHLMEQTELLFGKENSIQRRLELPIFDNLVLLRKKHTQVEDTLSLLTYAGVKVKDFGPSRYWIRDRNSDDPLVSKFDGSKYLPPGKDKIGRVLPVLHANTRLDVFCGIDNKFATPKQEDFEKCMKMLEE